MIAGETSPAGNVPVWAVLNRHLGQTEFVATEYSPLESLEWGDQLNVDGLVTTAWALADDLPEPAQVRLALAWMVSQLAPQSASAVQQVLDADGLDAELLRQFTRALLRALDEAVPAVVAEEGAKRRRRRHVESVGEALKRQAEPELINEILAGGAVAASFAAAASVAKAKIEATTQRRKNDLDNETQRLKIASDERIAMLQPRFQEPVFQANAEDVEPDGA